MMTIESRNQSDKKLAELEDSGKMCGAITNNNEHCLHTRGFGTDHLGEGRCLQHDGISGGVPVARYDIPSLKERMEEFLHDKDIYSLDREIALLRSYLELYNYYLELFKGLKKFTTDEMEEVGIRYTPVELNTALNQTTKSIALLVKTKNDIEISRKFVIKLDTVELMFRKIAEIIDSEIEDPLVKNQIGYKIGQLMITGG